MLIVCCRWWWQNTQRTWANSVQWQFQLWMRKKTKLKRYSSVFNGSLHSLHMRLMSGLTSLPIELHVEKQTALDWGQDDHISLTHDLDLQSPVSHGHDLLTCKRSKVSQFRRENIQMGRQMASVALACSLIQSLVIKVPDKWWQKWVPVTRSLFQLLYSAHGRKVMAVTSLPFPPPYQIITCVT